ncbi:MAG: tetratricopeptide repeat protein [Saprospiraceae bacterium]|nr:tetratricopeptide repeat protein [Saprospiraceae bacterium]
MVAKLSRTELKRLLQESQSKGDGPSEDADPLDQKAAEGYRYLEESFDATMSRLDQRFAESLQGSEKTKTVEKGAKVRRFIWVRRVAAIGIVLIMASYFLFQSKNSASLYDRFFEPPSSHYYQATRSNAETDELTSAFIPYEKGDFATAFEAINSLQKSHTDKLDLAFYAAISKLAEGDVEAAIPMLESCLSLEYQGVDQMAPWYLGLAYLKAGKLAEAKQYLQQIPEGSRFAQSAEQLLAEL